MFEDSTFESMGRIHTRSRNWMIATFFVNGSIVTALVLIPLLHPEALRHLVDPVHIAVPVMETAPPHVRQQVQSAPQTSVSPIMAPINIQPQIRIDAGPNRPPEGDTPGPISMDTGGSGIPGGTDVFRGRPEPVVNHPAAPTGPKTVSSGVMQGQLIYQVKPMYPAIARAVRMEGTVVLAAVISKSGTIENLRVVAGPAMLQQAALDAVKQWRYRPYMLDGQAVEVETTINVVFTLGR